MIKASSLTKIYSDGTRGLDQVSFEVKQGEFIVVIGPSGAGKSTMLRLVNGTIAPSSGELNVLGTDVARARAADVKSLRRQIGFVFQQFNLVKNLTAFENVLTGRLGYHAAIAGMLGLFSKEDRELADHYLREVGLEGRAAARADHLSGGQQQRVAIARALVQDPKIILADEPMASLDPRLSDVVLGLLREFNQKKNITVVVNIHVLELAKKYASRVLGLRDGKLVYDGGVAGLNDKALEAVYGR